MYIVKILGMGLLIIATSVYGFDLGSRYIKRIENLKELRKLIVILDGELRYNNTPIRMAFDRIAERGTSRYCEFLRQISRIMEEDVGIGLGEVWEKTVKEKVTEHYCLKERDVSKLIEFGYSMEGLDSESRNSLFEGYMSELDIDIKESCDEKENKVKLYRTMGVVSGLFIAILIV